MIKLESPSNAIKQRPNKPNTMGEDQDLNLGQFDFHVNLRIYHLHMIAFNSLCESFLYCMCIGGSP